MTLQTETRRAAEFLLSEAPGYRSRKVVTIDSSQTLLAGAVLGQITEGARTATPSNGIPAPAGATISAVVATLDALVGEHDFECVVGGAGTASKWRHTAPGGLHVGEATGNTEYTGGGLTATITDTGTDPVAGERFKVIVTAAAASGRYVNHDPEALNGAQVAAGVLYDAVTTGAGETADATVIVADAEVKTALLAWDDQDAGEKTAAIADLAALGVIARA